MLCKQCGSQIADGSHFCPTCGEKCGSEFRLPVRFGALNYTPESFRHAFWMFILFNVIYYVLHFYRQYRDELVAESENPIFLAISLILMLIALFFGCRLLYRCWAVIQDGHGAATTPGKAVGFYFIPFFNCFWAFIAQWYLAKNMNEYCRNRDIDAPQINETVAFFSSAMPSVYVLYIFASISYFVQNENSADFQIMYLHGMMLISIVHLVLYYLLYDNLSRAAMLIQRHKLFSTDKQA